MPLSQLYTWCSNNMRKRLVIWLLFVPKFMTIWSKVVLDKGNLQTFATYSYFALLAQKMLQQRVGCGGTVTPGALLSSCTHHRQAELRWAPNTYLLCGIQHGCLWEIKEPLPPCRYAQKPQQARWGQPESVPKVGRIYTPSKNGVMIWIKYLQKEKDYKGPLVFCIYMKRSICISCWKCHWSLWLNYSPGLHGGQTVALQHYKRVTKTYWKAQISCTKIKYFYKITYFWIGSVP